MSRTDQRELFTASEVARFCHVDLKTIHNWSDRGEIPHFRTPGRHLRFRRADVVEFLRKYGYPVPEQLQAGRTKVHVVGEARVVESIRARLDQTYDIAVFNHAVDALISIGAEKPDIVILDLESAELDGATLVSQLHANPATQHIRIVALASDDPQRKRASEAGAAAVASPTEPAELERVIEELTRSDA
jgi:excisionase family DNA binding protein